MSSDSLDKLQVSLFDENARTLSLNELRNGRAMIIDFWTTKCVKCPAALEKLNEAAASSIDSSVLYVSCALSQGPGNKEVVMDMVDEWEDMTHCFMESDQKEEAKNAFGFSAVPFVIIVDKSGSVISSGDPKSVDYVTTLKTAAAASSEVAPAVTENAFSLDEDF